MTTLLLYLMIQFSTPSTADKAIVVTGDEPQKTIQQADNKGEWFDGE